MEGGKFVGTMKITPVYAKCDPYLVTGTWMYDKDSGCWINGTTKYNEKICEIVKEEDTP